MYLSSVIYFQDSKTKGARSQHLSPKTFDTWHDNSDCLSDFAIWLGEDVAVKIGLGIVYEQGGILGSDWGFQLKDRCG